MTPMSIERILTAQPAADGGGVRLHRLVGPDGMRGLDPFLLFDEFGSDEPDDYIAGFPPHPHRGFETVTYMLEGEMMHEDHLGHTGILAAGGVQWMTAGRGVIHSEMPRQTSGRMRGFQLWINLPARDKLTDPAYRHIPAEAIPVVTRADGVAVRVIAGCFSQGESVVQGAVRGIVTEPTYLDARLPARTRLEVPIPSGQRALVYGVSGRIQVAGHWIEPRQMAVLASGETIELQTDDQNAQVLIPGRTSAERTHRPVRPLRYEHTRRDPAGHRGL
jgi:quercetin 2,3-dioxygenase